VEETPVIRSSAIESGVVALGSRRAGGGDIDGGAERGDETAVGWDGGGEAEAEDGPVAGEGRRPSRRASDSGTSVDGDEEADGEATGNEVCEPDRTSGESARNGTEPPFAGGSERASESGCREAEAIRARDAVASVESVGEPRGSLSVSGVEGEPSVAPISASSELDGTSSEMNDEPGATAVRVSEAITTAKTSGPSRCIG
jgi:hypothetical protein